MYVYVCVSLCVAYVCVENALYLTAYNRERENHTHIYIHVQEMVLDELASVLKLESVEDNVVDCVVVYGKRRRER